jgi:hypothetical protein
LIPCCLALSLYGLCLKALHFEFKPEAQVLKLRFFRRQAENNSPKR